MRWENIDYLNLDLVEGPKSNYQDIAKERVEVSAFFVLVVPGVLLLVLAVIFKLLAWAVAGFKPK